MIKEIKAFPLLLVCIAALFLLSIGAGKSAHGAPLSSVASSELVQKIKSEGRARVIVKLRMERPYRNEIRMSRSTRQRQRAEIVSRQGRIKALLKNNWHRIKHEFKSVPYLAMEIDASGLEKLQAAGFDVASIREDRLARPFLAESIPQVEGDLTLQAGMDGSGSVIAVIDSGVDSNHSFLANKVVGEACFASSESGVGGDCPNGQASQVGTGAAEPCGFSSSCRHGTHVAGIAAGSGNNFSGVAPGADLIAIQVFHSSQACFFLETTPCPRAYESDLVAALEHVYQIRDQYPIAAVNMSLGAEAYTTNCDVEYPSFLEVIDNLKAAGIATVAASGNDGFDIGVSVPSCISSAISVGAVDEANDVAFFSNVSQDLDLFAPGTAITSSVPGFPFFDTLDGTSMAAPHVAGAWAVMQQVNPGTSVDDNLALLQSTGRPITDFRSGDPASIVTRSGLRLGSVIGISSPLPVLASIAPTTISAGGTKDFTVTGSDFSPSSVVLANGIAMPTTFVSATELSATVVARVLTVNTETYDIAVFTPPLGGGTSTSVAIDVVPPELAVDTTSVDWGEPVTVTLSDGPGNNYDWIALAEVGDPDETYIEFVYVAPGSSSASWTVNMPDTAGAYEFRLFADNGYTRLSTSPTVSVISSAPPPPPPALAVSATSVDPGDAVTVDLNDGPGNDNDWIALARVGDPDTTYLDLVYVSAGSATATWTLNMPDEPGSYEFRLFENFGFTRLATSPTVTVISSGPPPSPALVVTATDVNGGDSVSVTLSDGPGNDSDWIALAAVGDPDTTYLQYVYVGSGATTATWAVDMPSEPGSYEFRLFENNGYTRLATSPTVTVTSSDPPPEPPALAVSATSAGTGDSVTVTLSDGPGNASDWIALAAVGDADTIYLQSVYVAAGATTTSWTVNMPTTPGDYEFRLFENNGYTRLATSPTVTVVAAPAALGVSATTVASGEAVTVDLNDGPGNDSDWIALAAVGAPDATYLQYIYVSPGATTASWTVNMPSEPGSYEFRLFENNGFTRLATSSTITVTSSGPPPSPALAVTATEVSGGDSVTVTLSDGPGNDYDWIGLAAVGDPDATYLQYTYVGPGSSTASWTVSMPTEPGAYEFRLFEDNGYTRLATSPTVTVTSSEPPPPPPALAVSDSVVGAGDAVTVTLSDGPGNASDWIALAAVGDADTVYLQNVYVAAGSSTATWAVNMPTTPGDYEFRLFEDDGYTRLATSATVTVQATPAALAVSATTVDSGDAVTVTLSGGPGNDSDWIALAAVGDPDSAYLQYVYVSAGATTATWTVNMPVEAGDYEFRLLENNGYTRLATSPAVTVTSSAPPPEPPGLVVNASAVNGGDEVTVTMDNGPGNDNDWIALARVGDPDTTYLQNVYVSAGSSTATWTVSMPTTPGDYEFRLFENFGYTRLATSPTVTVVPPPPPSLVVTATEVSVGDAVTVSLADGPGNDSDWIALAAVGDADTTYVQYIYIGSGETSATWTVNMPTVPGSYEFRLFENNGYTRLATSPTMVVSP